MAEETATEKGIYLSELRPGEAFGPSIFVARDMQASKGNGPRLTLNLRDASCPEGIRAIFWNPPESLWERLTPLRENLPFVRVEGVLREQAEYGRQIVLTRIEPVTPSSDLAPFLPLLPLDHESDKERFKRLLRSVREPHLAALLQQLFAPEVWAAFRRAVAAATRHHAGPGGLLRHTVEVAELADAACGIYPDLRRDLLVTGALLHDYGKLTEMEHGVQAGEYTRTGCLEGHIVDGYYRVRRSAEGITGFPEGLLSALTHLILSHHGRPEWGAAREPAIPEAIVLATCDKLSADVSASLATVREARQGVSNTARCGDYRLYVGDLDLDGLDFGTGMLPPEPAPWVRSTNQFATARLLRLPILGTVAAGPEDAAASEPEGHREVVSPPEGADYLLRVTGDSMTDEGIRAGDLVLVQHLRGRSPRFGEIVVAQLPGAAGGVIKRFEERDGMAWLVSANLAYAPLPVTEEARLQGRVVGLLRDY